MFIDNEFVESETNDWLDLHNPATNEVITRVPKCTQAEMQRAVASCERAFEQWSTTTILTRQQHMFKLQQLIRENIKKLAANITEEQVHTRLLKFSIFS